MFLILPLLVVAHIFADFFLQQTRLGIYKRKNILALAAHAITWAFSISLVLIIAGIFLPWNLFFLFVSHFIIDWLKIRFFDATLPMLHPVNVTDQFLHFLTILVVLYYG